MLRATLALVCFSLTLVFHLFVAGAPAAASAGPGAAAYVNPIVSGTNCAASGTFAARPGGYVKQVILYIGGMEVKRYTYGVDDSVRREAHSLGVTWASTRFEHGASVPVRVWGKDDWGNEREDTKFTSIYNWARVLANDSRYIGSLPLGDEAASHVHSVLTGSMRHASSLSRTALKQSILDGLLDDTVFFHWTHGNSYWFGDCAATPTSGDEHYLHWTEVQAANDKTNYPPYNFVHLCACHSASEYYIAKGFGVVGDGGAVIPDRALLGWQTGQYASQNTLNWVQSVWTCMAGGWTVAEAVWLTTYAWGHADADAPGDRAARHQIQGDPTTKLVSVYGGERNQWYR